jgi:hypothetical protein
MEPSGFEDAGASEDRIQTDEWIEEEVPVEPGGTLYVDLDRGSVCVESHDADTVRVAGDARGWSASMARFVLEKVGSDVQLDLSFGGWLRGLFLPARVEVVVWVPRRYSVEVGTRGGRIQARNIGGRVGLDTSGGHIRLSNVDGPALLRTSGGHVEIEDVRGDLRARTSGGHIRARQVRGNAEARTGGGRIELEDIGGEVDARTSGGRISVSFREEPWGRAETSGGSIEVSFRKGTGAELDARTSGGRIEVDSSIRIEGRRERSRIVGRLNDGGAPLHLRTSGGSIRLRER